MEPTVIIGGFLVVTRGGGSPFAWKEKLRGDDHPFVGASLGERRNHERGRDGWQHVWEGERGLG